MIDRQEYRLARSAYLLSAVFAIAGLLALRVDLPVGFYARSHRVPGDLGKLINLSEVFAHGFGALMILVTAWVLWPPDRRKLFRVGTCAFGSGAVAQLLKQIVGRIRPNAFDYQGSVLETFTGWGTSAIHHPRALSAFNMESFPSGHTAVAVGLAFGLAWLFPRGKWLFALFAALAASQRILAPVHYVSDAMAGAVIASVVAGLCLGQGRVGRFFDWFENRVHRAS